MDTTRLTDPFIWVCNDVVPEKKCKQIINKFEKDINSAKPGIVYAGYKPEIKKSLDLNTNGKKWKTIDNYFQSLVSHLLGEYQKHLRGCGVLWNFNDRSNMHILLPPNNNWTDTGYQIQKTNPGEGYIWHHDYQVGRLLTFILYLNTVEEGWTQFWNGDQVAPEAGRCLMFPATWTYYHQGYPPKQTKYIMTGWLHE